MRTRLTDAKIAALRPREREYTVWDERVSGLGVRVRPSGHRSYVFLRDGRRASLGPAALKAVDEARRECLEGVAPAETAPSFEDFVANQWRAACYRHYKPSTQRMVDFVLNGRLLPTFGSTPLDRITAAEVGRWFDRYSRTAPGGANRTLDLFRQMMNHAIMRGHIERNPAQGIKRNRRPRLSRFLSREELRRLHAELDGCGRGTASRRQQADIVRLLLATGCRKGEIAGLQWREVDEAALNLADGKTGPRKVFLNAQARSIIERQPRTESPYVFPSPSGRPRSGNLAVWHEARSRAGLEDVRLHDLRHTFASHAVMQGVPLPVVARLLGHRNVRMTLRYAHVADRDVEAAAERSRDLGAPERGRGCRGAVGSAAAGATPASWARTIPARRSRPRSTRMLGRRRTATYRGRSTSLPPVASP